jgi:hypothetical protein
MDTEGIFNDNKSKDVWGRIFGVSIRFSSVLMFNVDHKIGNNTLEDLRLFVSLGNQLGDKIQLPGEKKNSLQKLVFMVRNCTHTQGWTAYGKEGGQDYLNKILDVSSKGTNEARNAKVFVKETFEHIECYLLPHPFVFQADANHESQYSLFERQLRLIVENLLDAQNLVVKEVAGNKATGEAIFPLFRKACQGVSQVSSVRVSNAIMCFLLSSNGMEVYRAQYLALIEQVCRVHNNGNVCKLIRKETMTKKALLQEFNGSLNCMTEEEKIFLRSTFAEELEKVPLPINLLPPVHEPTVFEKWTKTILEKLELKNTLGLKNALELKNALGFGGFAWFISEDFVNTFNQFGKTAVNVEKVNVLSAVPILIYLAIQMGQWSNAKPSKGDDDEIRDLTKANATSEAMKEDGDEKIILDYFNKKLDEAYRVCTETESCILPKDFVTIFKEVIAEIMFYFNEYWSHCTNSDKVKLSLMMERSLGQKVFSLWTLNKYKLMEKRSSIFKDSCVVTVTTGSCIALCAANQIASISSPVLATLDSLLTSYNKYKKKKRSVPENESSSNEATSILLRQHPNLTEEDLKDMPTDVDKYIAFLEKHIPQLAQEKQKSDNAE